MAMHPDQRQAYHDVFEHDIHNTTAAVGRAYMALLSSRNQTPVIVATTGQSKVLSNVMAAKVEGNNVKMEKYVNQTRHVAVVFDEAGMVRSR